MKKSIKHIKEVAEYAVFLVFLNIIKLLRIDTASNICAAAAKYIGPKLRTNRIIRNNLKYVYPNITDEKIDALQKEIWDNFGRYIGEFPYVNRQTSRVEIENIEVIEELQKKNIPFIAFCGHFANWDFVLPTVLKEIGFASVIYRKINNKFIDKYVRSKRASLGAQLICKGPKGAKDLIKAIKERNVILMLVDQKMNEGIKVPFLNKPAMTSEAIAVIARHYNYPIVPSQIIRKNGANFKVIFHTPFFANRSDEKENDVYETMLKINDSLSDWVNENPGQWFWMHQRWGKKKEML